MKVVCIPALKCHYKFVEYSISSLSHYLTDIKFIIVTPNKKDFEYLTSTTVTISSDNYFSDINLEKFTDLLVENKKHLAKWYYQQFLKYSIVSKLEEFSDVLILDADTIILSEKIIDNYSIFTTNLEYNQSYFHIIKNWFPTNKLLPKSAIVNFMWFNKILFIDMLNSITNISKTNWPDSILNYINNSNDLIAFSEYETYANFKFNVNNPDLIPLKIFRRADLFTQFYSFEKIHKIANHFKFDVISFESHHKSNFYKKLIVLFLCVIIEIKLFFSQSNYIFTSRLITRIFNSKP